MLARVTNIILGFWLMASVFVWPHTGQERMLVGVLISWFMVVFALMSFVEPSVRFANTAMSVLLIITALFETHASRITLWHNLVLGLVAAACSLVPNRQLVRHEIKVGPDQRIRV